MAVSPRELHRIVPNVIVYNKEGKLLITRRSLKLKSFPGRWNAPGGGLSMDDYDHLPSSSPNDKQWYGVIEQGLRREVREEVGIEIGKPTYLLDLAFVRPDGVPVLVLTYYAPYVSGEIQIEQDEVMDFAWVTLEEAKNYDLIEGIIEELEMVDTILKNDTLHSTIK